MAGPWLVAIAAEYLMFRLFFARDLAPVADAGAVEAPRLPKFVLVVLGLTLAGFAVTSFLGLEPVWAALAGALVLGWAQPGTPPQHLVAAWPGRCMCRSWFSCWRSAWWCRP